MASEITLTQTGDGLLGQTSGFFSLRVCNGEHGGRVLRLSSQKCTIGSGPQCTLRLRGRGFRPLHCLILRGESGTYIRRWSPDTCLNGRGFSVARLQTGDRIHIGAVEFEVLGDGCSDPEEVRQTRQLPAAEHPDPNITRLEQEVEHLESQLAELQGQNDAVVSECERAGQESEAARTSVLDLQQQLETAQAALIKDRGKWESEQSQLQTQLNERTAQLEQLREELGTYQQKMDQSRQESESQSHQLTEANQQLQEAHQQLQQANEQLSRELQEAIQHSQQQVDQQPLIQELRDALAELKQQFDNQANEKQQLQGQVQAAQSHCVELEQALATTQERLDETSQLTARVEEVTSELESARSDMESRTQKWEGQLADRRSAIQELREQLERAGKDYEQQVAERENIASRLAQLEQENEQLVSRIAELQQSPPASPNDQDLGGSDSPEWKETVAGLQSELDRTRSEHRQAVAEWQSDRTNLEEQLADRSDKLTRLQQQHDTSMQQAEQLIYSLQQEGKQLLSQLDEAKYTIRHETEQRKQLEVAQESERDESGAADQLRQTVQILQEKCQDQEDEIGRQTVMLRTLVDEPTLPNATVQLPTETELHFASNEPGDWQSAAEAETQDRPPRACGEDTSDEAQPASTLVLGSEFKPEMPEEVAEIVARVTAGERPTEDRQPPPGPEQVEGESFPFESLAHVEPSAAEADDEEHVIQIYMERLLQRVGCKSQETPNREETPVRVTANKPAQIVAESNDNVQSKAESEGRTSTAEMAEDLLAMRELANRSARMAISSSDRRRVFMAASGEFGAATVSLGVSSTVIAMSPNWMSVYSIGGYIGLAFGFVWTLYGLRSLFDARALRNVADE